jgi:Phage-related protein, predicted endonuclease
MVPTQDQLNKKGMKTMPNVLVSTKDMSKDEWLQWRKRGIGGSDASIVCGLNRYKSPVELWMEKRGNSNQR